MHNLIERISGLPAEVDRVMILARQLVDGWYNTTPANEWSEFDESTRQEMRKLHEHIAEFHNAAPAIMEALRAAKEMDLDWIIRTHPSVVVRKQAEALRSKLAELENL